MPLPPKPNTQALSWFYGEYKNKTLRLTPKYQRNPIWSIGQKCFLIDSIISGCPIPQVFLNILSDGMGAKKKTYYDVVDGQQRLRAIIEFMLDEYALIKMTEKSYPVSEEYKPHIGKKYSELPTSIQDSIWDYQLAVQELRGWEEGEIRSLFRRLNYVVERLNKQEMRHSQYFGEFVEAVETLSNEKFFDDIQLFTRRDSQRMLDVEFVSELFILLIDGPQDQQKSIDSYYADFDVSFPGKKRYMAHFRRILESLLPLSSLLHKTRFRKKADFYGLFGAITATSDDISYKKAERKLKELDSELQESPENMGEFAAKYYSTLIEGSNKLPKRKSRINILLKVLS